MGFYKNTHTEIIKITPEIAAENNTDSQKLNVAIPVGSVCSFNKEDFGCFNDYLFNTTVHLRCIKSTGNCTGCYFRYLSGSFCPVCSKDDRPDKTDVIFEEISEDEFL